MDNAFRENGIKSFRGSFDTMVGSGHRDMHKDDFSVMAGEE